MTKLFTEDPFSYHEFATAEQIQDLASRYNRFGCEASRGTRETPGIEVTVQTMDAEPTLVSEVCVASAGSFWFAMQQDLARSTDPTSAETLIDVTQFLGPALTSVGVLWRPASVEKVPLCPSGSLAIVKPGRSELSIATAEGSSQVTARLPLCLPPQAKVEDATTTVFRTLPAAWSYEGLSDEERFMRDSRLTLPDWRASLFILGALSAHLLWQPQPA